MAKNVVPVKSQTPLVDDATKASLDVIRSAENLAKALGHAQTASAIVKALRDLGNQLDVTRQEIRDWKHRAGPLTNDLPDGLRAQIAEYFDEISHALDGEFTDLGDILTDKLDACAFTNKVPL